VVNLAAGMCYGLSRSLSRLLIISIAPVASASLFLLGACGGKPKPGREIVGTPAAPAALILDKEISGQILGQTLKAPASLAVGRRGALFAIDAGNNRVIWFNRDLAPVRDYGGQGSPMGRFAEPRYLTVDVDQNVWVSDFGRRRLVQCSEQLEFIGEIDLRDDADPFSPGRPGGVLVTGFGEIWVVDTDNDRITVLDPLGEIDHFVGDFGYPGGPLRQATKLTSDGRDYIYVCDAGNRRVMVYDDRGGVVRKLDHPVLESPHSVAVDPFQRIWILERDAGTLHCFSREGSYLATVGPIVSGADRPLSRPADLVFLPDGRVVVADTGHDRMLVCRLMSASN